MRSRLNCYRSLYINRVPEKLYSINDLIWPYLLVCKTKRFQDKFEQADDPDKNKNNYIQTEQNSESFENTKLRKNRMWESYLRSYFIRVRISYSYTKIIKFKNDSDWTAFEYEQNIVHNGYISIFNSFVYDITVESIRNKCKRQNNIKIRYINKYITNINLFSL